MRGGFVLLFFGYIFLVFVFLFYIDFDNVF
jgi:hypothetical protein